jgi:hypothetical protein
MKYFPHGTVLMTLDDIEKSRLHTKKEEEKEKERVNELAVMKVLMEKDLALLLMNWDYNIALFEEQKGRLKLLNTQLRNEMQQLSLRQILEIIEIEYRFKSSKLSRRDVYNFIINDSLK